MATPGRGLHFIKDPQDIRMGEESTPEVPTDAAPEVTEEQDKPAEDVEAPLDPPCMDLSDFKPKVDHFEQIHALGEEGSIPGAPNFRQVKDFPVFGCAQPTEDGMMKVLAMAPKGADDKPAKTIWFNM